jgi:hypothetical protein
LGKEADDDEDDNADQRGDQELKRLFVHSPH